MVNFYKLVSSNLFMESPTLLALDLGTQTGWALLHKKNITSGTINFKNDRYQGGGMRYLRFSQWLESLKGLLGEPITALYFEEVRRHLGVDAAHNYGGFLATLSSWCELNIIPYQGVPVGSIKRHITGKGNAGKEEVKQAVRAKGFDPKDDNEADSLALLDFVSKVLFRG